MHRIGFLIRGSLFYVIGRRGDSRIARGQIVLVPTMHGINLNHYVGTVVPDGPKRLLLEEKLSSKMTDEV